MADAVQLSAELVINETAFNQTVNRLNRKPFKIQVDDRASLPLGRITGQTKSFDKAISAATDRVVAFGAAASAFYAVQRAVQALVKSTVDVEASLARININLNESTGGLKDFSRELFSIARNTGNTFDEAAKGAEELTRQGLGATETLKRLNDVLILSRQTGLSTADSVEAITAAINSFTKEALSSSAVVNKLAAVDQKFAVSSRDLAEGISRAGSTAADAGVSFNELLGLITAVQQTTQRGGAVIGNSFKTFFAKLSDKNVLDNLEAIGLGVRNISGEALPATQILENLGRAYGGLSDAQKKLVNDNVGTLFQINALKATLADVGDQFGIVARATEIANKATDQAVIKNAKLNDTLKSSFNSLQQSITQVLSGLGSIKIGPLLDSIIKSVDQVAQTLGGSDSGADAGKSIGQSILQGISNVLTGPGVILLVQLFAKTAVAIGRTVTAEFQSILKINNASEARLLVQDRINNALAKSTDLEYAQFKAASSTAEQQRIILAIIERQNSEMVKGAAINRALVESLLVRTGGRTRANPATGPATAAGGLLPAVASERASINRGVGGASSSARPVLIPNFAFGGGKKGPVVANTSEYIVPNYAGGGSAIFNPDMVKAMGLPNGARHLAGGYTPFNEGRFAKGGGLLGFANKPGVSNIVSILSGLGIEAPATVTSQSLSDTFSSKKNKLSLFRFLQDNPIKIGNFPENYSEVLDGNNRFALAKAAGIKNIPSINSASGFIPNFADFFRGVGGQGGDKALRDLIMKGNVGSPGYGQTFITPDMQVAADYAGNNATKVFNSGGTDRGYILGIDTNRAKDPTGTMQHSFAEKVLPGLSADEVKTIRRVRTISGEGMWDYSTQVGKPRSFSRFSKLYKGLFGAARGFVPNYANPLAAAIGRETAAGTPPSSIYIDHDKRLAGVGNPGGLLVANKFDEPLGGHQGISRVLAQGRNPKFAGLAGGYVPNFAINSNDALSLGAAALRPGGIEGFIKSLDLSNVNFDVQERKVKQQILGVIENSLDIDVNKLGPAPKKAFAKLATEVLTVRGAEIQKIKAAQRAASDAITPTSVPARLKPRLGARTPAELDAINQAAKKLVINRGGTSDDAAREAAKFEAARKIGVGDGIDRSRTGGGGRRAGGGFRATPVAPDQPDRALSLALLATFGAGFVEPTAQRLGVNTRGGTIGGQVTGGLEGALQGIGNGALIGSAIPGVGTAGGAIAGGIFGGLIGVFGKLTKTAEELNDELDKSNAVYAKNVDAVERIIALTNQEDNLGPNATPAARRALAQEKVRASASITDAKDRAALLGGGLSERDTQDILIRNAERQFRGIASNNATAAGSKLGPTFGDRISRFAGTTPFADAFASNPFQKQAQIGDFASQIANLIDKDNIGGLTSKGTSSFLNKLSSGRSSATGSIDIDRLKQAFESIGAVGTAAEITGDNLNEFAEGLKKAIGISKAQQALIEEQIKKGREQARLTGNRGDFRSAPLFGGTGFGDIAAQQRSIRFGAGAGNSTTADTQRASSLSFFDLFKQNAPKASDAFFADKGNQKLLENAQALDEFAKALNAAADLLQSANPEGRYRDDFGKPIQSAVTSGLSQQAARALRSGNTLEAAQYQLAQSGLNTQAAALPATNRPKFLNGFEIGAKYSSFSPIDSESKRMGYGLYGQTSVQQKVYSPYGGGSTFNVTKNSIGARNKTDYAALKGYTAQDAADITNDLDANLNKNAAVPTVVTIKGDINVGGAVTGPEGLLDQITSAVADIVMKGLASSSPSDAVVQSILQRLGVPITKPVVPGPKADLDLGIPKGTPVPVVRTR